MLEREERPGTFYDDLATKIWRCGSGGNGTCWVLKIDDKFRILKKYNNRSGTRVNEIFENDLHSQVPLSPKYIDCSKNHEDEIYDWILTDYIPGNTLTQFINGGYVGMRIKKVYTLEILGALAFQLKHMKKQGIKHRDLKPDNVVIDADFIPHIIDWDDSTDRFSVSSIDSRRGTVPFSAPELFEHERKCESDIFSFGGIMYNFITGMYPFERAYKTRAGLEVLASRYDRDDLPDLEATLSNLENFETMNKSDKLRNWPTIVSKVSPIVEKLVRAGIRDDVLLLDADFNQDPFNHRIADLIMECWKQDPKDRITPKELQKRIDNMAIEFLTDPAERDHYDNYFIPIYSLIQKVDGTNVVVHKEYGTEEMINKAIEFGLYENNAALIQIIKYLYPSFIEPTASVFTELVQSRCP